MLKTIIITDLDGTLLHPTTYSLEEAQPALTLIRERGIPLILCSSKTRPEMEVYRKRLNNKHPFIPENGGGVFIPGNISPSLLTEMSVTAAGSLLSVHLMRRFDGVSRSFGNEREWPCEVSAT